MEQSKKIYLQLKNQIGGEINFKYNVDVSFKKILTVKNDEGKLYFNLEKIDDDVENNFSEDVDIIQLLSPVSPTESFIDETTNIANARHILDKLNSDLTSFTQEDIKKLYSNVSIDSLKRRRSSDHSKNNLEKTSLVNSGSLFFLRLLTEIIAYYKKNILDSDLWHSKDSTNPKPTFDEKDWYYASKITFPDNAKIHVIGDIHGSLHSLLFTIYKTLHLKKDVFISNSLKLKDDQYIIFTGDIVDYSFYGIECLAIILLLKRLNLNNVIICDGNHEDEDTYNSYDLTKEMVTEIIDPATMNNINKLLKVFPTVVFGKLGDELFQFNHGSIPKRHSALEFNIKEFIDSENIYYNLIGKIEKRRHITITNAYGYKWGDFSMNTSGNSGIGRPVFNKRAVKKYLTDTGISAIFSGHQDLTTFNYLPQISNRAGNFLKFYIDDKTFLNKIHNKMERKNLYDIPSFIGRYERDADSFTKEGNTPPTKKEYNFTMHPSKLLINGETIDKKDTRKASLFYAMTQSMAGVSKKAIEYTSVSTLYMN